MYMGKKNKLAHRPFLGESRRDGRTIREEGLWVSFPEAPQLPRDTAGSLLAHRMGGDLVETSSPVPTERQPAHPTAEGSSPQRPFPQRSKLESACRAQKTLLRVRFSNNT